jgi:selenide,water dikinase
MTDVTGFGLLGHLAEMCEGSGVTATIEFDKLPVIPSVPRYLEQGCIPGGTVRNWKSYGHKIGPVTDAQRSILADPQTSGGLLVAVTEQDGPSFEELLRHSGLPAENCRSIGWLREPGAGPLITVN